MVSIRLANDNDFEQIFEIWLSGIQNSFDTTDIEHNLLKEKFKRNFSQRQGIFNYWVAIIDDKIIGWQSLSKMTNNPLKDNIYAEYRLYVHKSNRKSSLGRFLVNHIFLEAKKSKLEFLVAYISYSNEAIRQLSLKTGWHEIGIIPQSLKSNNKFSKLITIKPV